MGNGMQLHERIRQLVNHDCIVVIIDSDETCWIPGNIRQVGLDYLVLRTDKANQDEHVQISSADWFIRLENTQNILHLHSCKKCAALAAIAKASILVKASEENKEGKYGHDFRSKRESAGRLS